MRGAGVSVSLLPGFRDVRVYFGTVCLICHEAWGLGVNP